MLGARAFVDLPMRFTCAVASRTLRDACMRLSPRLEHELVLKRCPLLRTLPIGHRLRRRMRRSESSFARIEADSIAVVLAPGDRSPLFPSTRIRWRWSSRLPTVWERHGKSVYVGSRAIEPQVPAKVFAPPLPYLRVCMSALLTSALALPTPSVQRNIMVSAAEARLGECNLQDYIRV